MFNFFRELKRRHVYRVAIAYAALAWLILQIVSVITPIIDAPLWISKVILILLIAGFPVALILAWAFEMSPSGIVRTSSEASEENPYSRERKKPLTSNLIIGILLVIIAGQFVYNKYWANSSAVSTNKQEIALSEGDLNPEGLVTLAAIPFSNIMNDEAIDFLGFALVDQVISSLSYLQNIAIRPSSSIRRYGEQIADPKKVAEDLSVQYLLMGHYLKRADSVRLNLELIDVNGDKILWTGSVQEQMKDIFRLQDVVAQKVMDGLEIQFSTVERQRMIKDAPDNPLAYEYYLKALSLPFNVEGNQLAEGLLKKAADLDSSYAPIFAELGNRIHNVANYTILDTRYDKLEESLWYLRKALDLNHEYHKALGYLSVLHTETNEIEKALEVSKRILSINPNSSYGHFSLGYVYRYTGMLDESIVAMERAVSIDPKDNQFRSIGVTYSMAGRYEDAIRSLVYEDGSGFCESWRGLTYIRMNELDKARTELEKAIEIDPESTLGYWCYGILKYVNGESWSDDLKEKILAFQASAQDPETMYYLSLVNVMHKDYENFLKLYEKAIDLGFYPYSGFINEPILDPLREDPEFKRITEKARLKHETFRNRYF